MQILPVTNNLRAFSVFIRTRYLRRKSLTTCLSDKIATVASWPIVSDGKIDAVPFPVVPNSSKLFGVDRFRKLNTDRRNVAVERPIGIFVEMSISSVKSQRPLNAVPRRTNWTGKATVGSVLIEPSGLTWQ